jgi:group I intron endonuclease
LHQAIKKYGKENFEIKVLARCDSLEEMNHREAYYIKLFNTLRPNGYNLMSGGGNSKHSEETKRKIAKANIGKKRPEELKQKLRKPKSEAHKLKISAKLKGRKVPELVLQKRSYTKRQKLKLQIYDIK